MVIDASLLKAQCDVLQHNAFSEETFENMMRHPAMTAFLVHEKMLNRLTDENMIRNAMLTAGEQAGEGLLPKNIREILPGFITVAEAVCHNREKSETLVLERIARFSDCKIGQDNTVYLYALGKDGGFSPEEGVLYINLLYSEDNWMNILSHEMYHARELSETCVEKRISYLQLTEETDDIGDMLLSELAEEGIATLIQREGSGIPEKKDVSLFLERLKNWRTMRFSERADLYRSLSLGPQRYAVAAYLANKVLTTYGRQGLESWSIDGDVSLFHKILTEE